MKRPTLFKSNFAKLFVATFLTAGLTVVPTWVALAVTNPADNPHPITVTGDDGNTYVDGQDTLPGYDDEECTYIPGAYFDFAANRVRYADGQSIPWTEWDRASGYQDWLAKQNSSTTTDTTEDKTTSTETVKKDSSKTTTTEVVTETPITEEPAVTNSALAAEGVTVTFGGLTANNPGRVVGLIILGSLFGAGLLLLAGSALRARFQQGGNN